MKIVLLFIFSSLVDIAEVLEETRECVADTISKLSEFESLIEKQIEALYTAICQNSVCFMKIAI